MQSNFRGSLLGLAIGDALGMPVEGMTYEEIKQRFGEIRDFMPSEDGLSEGEWTDDTAQALILAESLLETVYFSPENFAEKLAGLSISHRFGPTSSQAIRLLRQGYSWRESGINSDTNGSAMRVAPIGLLYNHNYNLVEDYAVIASSITHKGSAAIAGCVAVAIGVACAANEDEELVSEVVRRAEKYDTLVAEKIEYAYQIRKSGLEKAIKELGNSIMAFESIPFAFYCFFSSKNFEQAVIRAVNAGGDADTVAAISGTLKGAETGIEGIPERLRKIKDYDIILDIADRLYEAHLKITRVG
ncbi:ADP-ribosylglycohydrolase family protein [Geoglobus acetivorans]